VVTLQAEAVSSFKLSGANVLWKMFIEHREGASIKQAVSGTDIILKNAGRDANC
jgi:hypothetical protein